MYSLIFKMYFLKNSFHSAKIRLHFIIDDIYCFNWQYFLNKGVSPNSILDVINVALLTMCPPLLLAIHVLSLSNSLLWLVLAIICMCSPKFSCWKPAPLHMRDDSVMKVLSTGMD